jgi:hypothetical protein
MKAENRIPVTKDPATSKPSNHRSTEAKAVVVPAWAPQPDLLTREEIRRIVIDQIG